MYLCKVQTKLIILDFDGTLCDTREIIIRTNQELMRQKGFPVLSEKAIMDTVGLPLEECLLVMYPDFPREQLPVWIKDYRVIFENLKKSVDSPLFPGVRETMAILHKSGCMLSVASSRSSDSLRGYLKEKQISQYINYVLGAEDVTLAKPNPEPVLKTLRDLDINASDALVVGDMPVDILMGLRAGVRTCGVAYGNSSREALLAAGADFVIDEFCELTSQITI